MKQETEFKTKVKSLIRVNIQDVFSGIDLTINGVFPKFLSPFNLHLHGVLAMLGESFILSKGPPGRSRSPGKGFLFYQDQPPDIGSVKIQECDIFNTKNNEFQYFINTKNNKFLSQLIF